MYHICNIANRKDLIGDNDERFKLILELWGVIKDTNSIIINVCYNPDYKNLIKPALESSAVKLDYISKYLGEKDYLCGAISISDFFLSEILARHISIAGGKALSKWANLEALLKRFEAIPSVRAYKEGSRGQNKPFNNPHATWK